MTPKEAAQTLAILKAAYPSSYKGMTPEEATGTVNVWAMQFRTVPADIVLMAVNKLISTSKFPPSICEVKEKLGSLYWEAYEIVSSRRAAEEYAGDLAKFQRIYDETHDFKHKQGQEPTLREMVGGGNLLLGKGRDS